MVKDEHPTGYLSVVYKACVVYGQQKQKLHLFIKSAHDEQERADFVSENGMDELELKSYTDILPQMVQNIEFSSYHRIEYSTISMAYEKLYK